jgi:hypothetical protein
VRILERDVARRVVVEAYARYDCSKKGLPLPDFPSWNWWHADKIDEAMDSAHLKTGVPAGYLLWDKVELTIPVLRDCAVFADIFPGQSRKLGFVERAGRLTGWTPKPERTWYRDVVDGRVFDDAAPFLLRPSLKSERPASWYIEDGSGRAVALVANHDRFSSQAVAIGYLGRNPDPNSGFMRREPFRELLSLEKGDNLSF